MTAPRTPDDMIQAFLGEGQTELPDRAFDAVRRDIHILPVDGPAEAADILTVNDRDQLERAFRRLTLEQRAVLVFHHYLGLSTAEVADRLDIPIGTAKSRLHHAPTAMRASLEADARTPSLSQERPA